MARMGRGVRPGAAFCATLLSLVGCLDAPPSSVGVDAGGGSDGGALDASPLDGWTRRAPVTVGSMGQSVDDVPVLVRLTPELVSALELESDLRDLRFADGATPLAHDLVAPASDGTANVYVRLPLLPADGITFDVYGGNPAASDGEAAPEVWQGFAGVWHLDERVDGEFADETGPHPAVFNGVGSEVSGAVGKGVQLIGGQALTVADHIGLGGMATVTAEIAIRPEQVDSVNRDAISNGTFELQVTTDDGGESSFLVWDAEGSGHAVVGALATESKWLYLAGTFDGVNLDIFHDGVAEHSVPVSVVLDDTSEELLIGRMVIGVIDEVRISPVARSTAWILAQQKMLADDGLVAVGDPTDAP